MTFNIRHDHGPSSSNSILAAPPTDLTDLSGELPWPVRKWKVADTLLFHQPDIVGLQEPVHHQVVDLHILVGDDYDWIGVGRDDGKEQGEYSAIFYKKDLLTVLDWKTLWLSETPDQVGSKGWGAKHPRTATIARFQSVSNPSTTFTVINTHFDHVSEEARQESAKLLLQEARQIKDTPVILMGDFNSTETDVAYQQLTNKVPQDNRTWTHLEALNDHAAQSFARTTGRPVRTTENSISLPTHRVLRRGQLGHLAQQPSSSLDPSVFVDSRYAVGGGLSGPFGHESTFTSFGEPEEKKNANRRIDYIMTLAPSPVNVLAYGVLDNLFDDGCLISDHRPVMSRLAWSV
ncbi:Endonuclease/exonuclease/phosphatase [Chlamydoabsidia padenii]|nr:Endonuclease/exonuclease/phosphatase [Chlamydoabsidia padenii]